MEKIRNINLLSLIIPIYNEEESIYYLYNALIDWIKTLKEIKVEIILINDGSKDKSLEILHELAEKDKNIKIISFSRNFGHQNAVTAGLCYAAGDAAVIIDADLQDPLDVINEMIIRYEEGYDVVSGKRISREGDTKFKLWTAWLFYRILRFCTSVDIPVDTGDFRLISRKAIDIINTMPEQDRFLRAMFAWIGFKQTVVPYVRKARKYGETKYPLCKMLSLAWDGIISFSSTPLRLISFIGICSAGLGFLAIMYALMSVFFAYTVPGWTSLMCLIAFFGGMILFSLGIIGEYVGKIYQELKDRPKYIVEEEINFEQGNDNSDGRA